jgi:hypothetical protein
MLPQLTPGSEETIGFNLEGKVIMPGILLDLPGSLEGLRAKGASVKRDADGNFILKLSDMVGGGLDFEQVPHGKVDLKVGDQGFMGTTGIAADAEVALKASSEASFKFNPHTAGDMTKMMAFMGALGVTSTLFPNMPISVGPPLSLLKDNLQEIKIGVNGEGKASGDCSALLKLASIDASVSAGGGLTLLKEDGHWKESQYLEFGGSANGQILTLEGGVEGKVTLESVTDLSTGAESAKVTVEVQKKMGEGVKLDDVKGFLPEDIKSISGDISQTTSDKLTVTYTLNKPADTVKHVLENSAAHGSLDLQTIANNSKIEVKTAVVSDVDLKAGGKVSAGVGESVGIEAKGTISRESERTVFSWNPESTW